MSQLRKWLEIQSFQIVWEMIWIVWIFKGGNSAIRCSVVWSETFPHSCHGDSFTFRWVTFLNLVSILVVEEEEPESYDN